MKHEEFLQELLQRTKRRLKLMELGAGAVTFLAVLVASLTLGVILDHAFALPKVARWAILLALDAGIAIALLAAVVFLLRRLNDVFIAKLIEKLSPGFRNTLVASIEARRLPDIPAGIREFIEEQAGVRYFEYNIDIKRRLIEEQAGVQYVEYTINDEEKCIGCAKCVKGCALMNGSLYMQVRHDLCVNCNECAIAIACPPQAFYRVPADRPVLLKRKARDALESHARHLSDQIARQSSQDKTRELEASLEKVQNLLGRDARETLGERTLDG